MPNAIGVLSVAVLTLGALAELADGLGSESVALQTEPVRLVSLVPTERSKELLAGDRVSTALPGAGGVTQVTVYLRRTQYSCRFTKGRGQQVRETVLQCYELDGDAPYTWAVFSLHPLGGFRLVESGGKLSYLSWADGAQLRFVDVSEPRDRCTALCEYLEGRGVAGLQAVPVGDLVPTSWEWGQNAFFSDIRIGSLRRLEDGTFELKITNPEGTESYTIVGQGMDWHLAQPGAAAGAPAKPETAKPESEKPAADGKPMQVAPKPEAAPPPGAGPKEPAK